MPNFFKSIFKPSSTRANRSTQPRPLPPEYDLNPASPISLKQEPLDPDELAALADLLIQQTQTNGHSTTRGFDHPGFAHADKELTMRRLVALLEDDQRDREYEMITPFPVDHGQSSSAIEKAASELRKSRKGKGVIREPAESGKGELVGVIKASEAGLGGFSTDQ